MYVPPKQNWNDEHSNVPVQWWALIGSCFSPLNHLQGSLLFHLPILILIHGYIGTPTCPTIRISPLWEQSSWLLCMWTLETIQTCSPRVFSHLIVKIKNRDHNQEGSYGILMTKEEQVLSLVQVWRYAGHKLHICIPYPTCGHKKFVSWSLTQNFGYYKMKYFPLVVSLLQRIDISKQWHSVYTSTSSAFVFDLKSSLWKLERQVLQFITLSFWVISLWHVTTGIGWTYFDQIATGVMCVVRRLLTIHKFVNKMKVRPVVRNCHRGKYHLVLLLHGCLSSLRSSRNYIFKTIRANK